jgi:hypothetical protein
MDTPRRNGVTGLAKKGPAGTKNEGSGRPEIAATNFMEIACATHAMFIQTSMEGATLVFATNRIIRVRQDNGSADLNDGILFGRLRGLCG